MGNTHRVTVPVVNAAADMTAVLLRLQWQLDTGQLDVTDVAIAIERLQRIHRKVAEGLSEADWRMEVIQGYTKVGGPNRLTRSDAAREGRALAEAQRVEYDEAVA